MHTNEIAQPIASLKFNNEDMQKYGITMVPVSYFHIGKYRYTHLSDAIAHAKHVEAENQVNIAHLK